MLKVIGIGSPFGDDQIGLLLIDELRGEQQLQPYLGTALELLALDRPGAGLLAQFEGVKSTVLIDAVVSGSQAQAGELHCWSDVEQFQGVQKIVSSHGLGLAQALELGLTLGTLPERLLILGIDIDPAQQAAGLSPSLAQQLPLLRRRILEKIIELLDG